MLLAAAAGLLAAFAYDAYACATCYGAPDDPMTKGLNNGIWVLLGAIGFVQAGLVAMFWTFWKRARQQRELRQQFRIVPATADPSVHSSYWGGPQE